MNITSFVPRSGKVRAGLIIVAVFVVIALVGPLVAQHDPRSTSFDMLLPPSGRYWLGTTQSGQDVFAQFVHGARVSLLVGLLAGVISQVFSVAVGLLGGYRRGHARRVPDCTSAPGACTEHGSRSWWVCWPVSSPRCSRSLSACSAAICAASPTTCCTSSPRCSSCCPACRC